LIKTPKNAIELNELLGAIVMKQLDSNRMYSFKTGEIKFESEEEIPWTLDGEFGGAHKEITVKDKKQAVQIIVDSEVAAGLSVVSEKVKK
ncbi:diacylglycerol kinase family lipid kinase, partial [[Ruminococcus] torques]|nr:diacylglycerol kinase family lipid kinase [[Ruminococcus] torques]